MLVEVPLVFVQLVHVDQSRLEVRTQLEQKIVRLGKHQVLAH